LIPLQYLEVIGDLEGVSSMLELGNKRGTDHEPYKPYFEALGIRHVCVDWNGLDGALALDLCQPLALGGFDVVTNFGTSEHVADQRACWENVVLEADRVIASVTPHPGDWPGHGFFYPSSGFYEDLARDNGFDVELLDVIGRPGRRMIRARLRRVDRVGPFVLPDRKLLTVAPPRNRGVRI
jgi:hypothetical protein